jgi:hypothetical protein
MVVVVVGFELSFMLAKQAFYCLSHTFSPFLPLVILERLARLTKP